MTKTPLEQQKIKNRYNQTYEKLKHFSISKLKEFLKTKYAQDDDGFNTFRLSSTDKLAIHKIIQEKLQSK